MGPATLGPQLGLGNSQQPDRPRDTVFQERQFNLHLDEAISAPGHSGLTAQRLASAYEQSESYID